MTEEWKSIIGYENLYVVSNYGNVKSIDRIVERGNKEMRIRGFELKPQITPFGYSRIKLSKNGKDRRIFAHILVAEAFIGNGYEGLVVNHKDGNKLNNYYKNLEWCTPSENIQHAYDTGLKVAPSGYNHGRTKEVINIETGIIYASAKDASKDSRYSRGHLIDMLNGKHKNKTSFSYTE